MHASPSQLIVIASLAPCVCSDTRGDLLQGLLSTGSHSDAFRTRALDAL